MTYRFVVPVLGLAAVTLACGPAAVLPTPTAPLAVTAAAPLEAEPTGGVTLAPLVIASPEGPTPTPTPEPVNGIPRSGALLALIEQVSAERLYQTVSDLSGIHSRHVNSTTIDDAAAYIFEQFEAAGGNLQVSYDEFPLVWNDIYTDQRNVIAVLPGSDPAAGVVLIGAHYDSRTAEIDNATDAAPGANDNASGTAVVIELARVLANQTPRATMVFAAFSAEEVGKIGSTHYVEQAQARGESFRAVFVLDIVGNASGPAGDGMIRAFSADPPDSASRQLARYVDVQGMLYLPGLDVQVQPAPDRPFRYSDHIPFSDAGFPAMRLIETMEDTNRQHNGLDTLDLLSPTYMQTAARLALAGALSAANGPASPGQPMRTAPDTLTWPLSEGIGEYVIAFRRPGELEYRSFLHVGGKTVQWEAIATGEYEAVAVAAVLDGYLSPFSPELVIAP